MNSFRLFWKDKELGAILGLSADQPEMYGTLDPPKLTQPFRELYEFITDEDNYDKDPPFDAELLNDENWYLLDEQGNRWEVYLPAIYPDDFMVCWRWRGEIPKWGSGRTTRST